MRKTLIVGKSDIVIKQLVSECSEFTKFTQVDDPIKAIITLLDERYDLIVTYLELEGMDGVQFINLAKNSQSINADIKIVLLTSCQEVDAMFDDRNRPNLIIKKDGKLIEIFKDFIQNLPVAPKKKLKVLYIDDDKFIQKTISLWFKKIDFIDLTVIGSVEEFKSKQTEFFDLIVADNMLTDGEFEDIGNLIYHSVNIKTPILVYTGTVEKLDLAQLQKKLNVLDILPKPFEMGKLLEIVHSLR